jgi:hypothetical protein
MKGSKESSVSSTEMEAASEGFCFETFISLHIGLL